MNTQVRQRRERKLPRQVDSCKVEFSPTSRSSRYTRVRDSRQRRDLRPVIRDVRELKDLMVEEREFELLTPPSRWSWGVNTRERGTERLSA